MDDIFYKAIQETFPNLDESTQKEIFVKVRLHMLELLKDKVFENNPDSIKKLDETVLAEKNQSKRFELYATLLFQKFASLSQNEQKTIGVYLDQELTAIMHQLYKAYV